MTERIAVGAIIVVLGYYLFNIYSKDKETTSERKLTQKIETSRASKHKREDLYSYIVDVINNGSSGNGFRGGEMEGGYISKDDAKVVACYVLELTGRKCPHSYPKDIASGYFSSVCAGCHGNDGKGINGTYPDLTKREYVGFRESSTSSKD